jgi:hypothetical protein
MTGFSQSPDPVGAGKEVEIDANGLTFPTTIRVVFDSDPASEPVEVTVNSYDELPIKVQVPAGTTAGTVEDGNGILDDFALAITP